MLFESKAACVGVALMTVAFVAVVGLGVLAWNTFQSRFVSKNYAMCSDEQFLHVRLPPNYLLKLHHLLRISHEILTEANVRYISIGGTLLSMARDGYLTPWDDDGDLAIFENDYNENRAKIAELMKKHRVHLNDPFWLLDTGVFHLRLDDDHPLQSLYPSEDQPFVDWMLFKRHSGDINGENVNHYYHYARPRQCKVFPIDYFTSEEMFPIQTMPLYAFSERMAKEHNLPNPRIELATPNGTMSSLNRSFGTAENPEMWRSCYLASSHRSAGLFIKPCKLTPEQAAKM